MSFHQENTHGRVFHGLEARNILEAHKRDSHGDKIVLHVPHNTKAAARPADPAQTNIQTNRLVHSPLQRTRTADSGGIVHSPLQATHGPSRLVHSPLQFTRPTDAADNKMHYIHNVPTSAAADNKMHFIHNAPSSAILDNKMRYIHNVPSAEIKNGEPVTTVESYVTAPTTVNGPIIYVTSSGAHDPVQATHASATDDAAAASSSALAAAASSYNAAKASAQAPAATNIASSSTLVDPSNTASVIAHTPLQFTRGSSTLVSSATAAGAAGGTPLQNSHGPSVVAAQPVSATRSSDAQVISKQDEGMSGGAKAGLAFGIIIALALAGGLVFFCWRRRKNQPSQDHQQILDEKHGNYGAADFRDSVQSEKVPASLRSTRTASTAPRLSLRPTTQFLAGLMENRKSSGNALDAPAMSEKPKSLWERRPQNAQDPFDDAAVVSEKQANPFDEGDGSAGSPNHSQKSSWEGSEPATPKSTKFGTANAVSVTSANAVPAGPNNVHRVQLDFKPSMDDELELKSGQLVRMLHEYDDGWALCIRMDRSQQGVCPRTCLSKLPVKPRPQGPPPNGPQGRPAPRPTSPEDNGMVPRPLTPNSQTRERSQTAGWNAPVAQETLRSRSASASDRSMSPAGISRKPVPGQAL